ncbi:Disease resistance protein RPS5-like protein [Drosera capensis]
MGSIFSVSIKCDALITQGYLRGLPNKLDELRSALNELEAVRNDVQRRVDVAEHGGNVKRLDLVQAWFTSVDDSLSEARALIEAANENNGCFCGTVERYKFGKRIVNKKGQLAELVSKGISFDVVGERLATKPATLRPSEPLVGVETGFDEIWRYFEDDHVGVIGLYGMGGVGKTALLTEFHNKLAISVNDFDYVIWVDMKRNQTLEEVQVSIEKKLGLDEGTLASKSEHDKYEDISRVLNGKKFVLLLDNLWERLDLLKAGVPYPNENNRCKILFTARSEILCGQMEAHKKIRLRCLEPDKAWELFCKKVRDDAIINHPEVIELAKSVVKECGGLPLALVTVGRAMASKKTPEEWSHAIETLRKSASEFSCMEQDVLLLLKFSYDSLPNDAIKACLLRLALYPESSEVSKRGLIRVWFAEGLLSEHDTPDNYENHGFDIIGSLLCTCLLEEAADDERYVRLHDVVRDMVLWVASECGTQKDMYLVEAGLRLRKVPGIGKWNNARVVSLMNNKIEEITEEPLCANLEALYLGHNLLRKIAPGFFSFMSALRVLDLSHNQRLTELHLEVCQLTALEYINLRFTGIRQLPVELRNLVNLKELDIVGTSQLTVIPRHVLSSLSALQSLRMTFCGSTNQMQEDNVISGGNELLIEEVQQLRNLIEVELTLRSDRALKLYLSSGDLMTRTRSLCIELLKDSTSVDITFLEVAKNLQWIYITDCGNLTSLITRTHTETESANTSASNIRPSSTMKQIPCFKKLRVIEVRTCPNLKDLTVTSFAPNLEIVLIAFCQGLERVIAMADLVGDGRETPTPFAKLRWLCLVNLPQLTSICDAALPFPVLNQVIIKGCPQLKSLPVDPRRAEGPKIKIWTQENWWSGLQWEDEAAANAFVLTNGELPRGGYFTAYL